MTELVSESSNAAGKNPKNGTDMSQRPTCCAERSARQYHVESDTWFQDLAQKWSHFWDQKGPGFAEKQNIIHSRMLSVSPSGFGPIFGTKFGPEM